MVSGYNITPLREKKMGSPRGAATRPRHAHIKEARRAGFSSAVDQNRRIYFAIDSSKTLRRYHAGRITYNSSMVLSADGLRECVSVW